MGVFDELKKALGTAVGQVTDSTPVPKDVHFSNNFQQQAKQWGLSEADARDVYQHGSVIKTNMMVRHYQGYEIGIYYFKDPLTGQVIVTSIWKRGRR